MSAEDSLDTDKKLDKLQKIVTTLGKHTLILKTDVSILKKDVSVLKSNVIDIRALLYVQSKRLDSIDERTALIPKLYDNVDKLMGEIIENRQERTFMSHLLSEHTKRITVLENRN